MTRHVRLAVVVAGGLALQSCVLSRQGVSPLGRAVQVTPLPDSRDREIAGELLAVSAESLWLARDGDVVSIPLERVESVRVRQSNLGASQVMGYSALVGLTTGAALGGACSSVEGASCGGVFPGVLLSWILWGGLASSSLHSTTSIGDVGAHWEQLRPYARFPQGLPDSLPRHGLTPPHP